MRYYYKWSDTSLPKHKRAKGGAQAMVDGGYGNTHTLTVSQCEKIAARKREAKK